MALTLDWSLLKLGIVEQNPNSPIFSFCDARNLDEILTDKIVDVTITSPPYFDLKDYGHKNQIGFSQDYGEYLNNLEVVFEKVYNVTKDTGSPGWFRKDQEVMLFYLGLWLTEQSSLSLLHSSLVVECAYLIKNFLLVVAVVTDQPPQFFFRDRAFRVK